MVGNISRRNLHNAWIEEERIITPVLEIDFDCRNDAVVHPVARREPILNSITLIVDPELFTVAVIRRRPVDVARPEIRTPAHNHR